MTSKRISGRLSSRVVGCIELLISFLLFGAYVWYLDDRWHEFYRCSTCVFEAIVFGLYAALGLAMSLLLILSTFTVFKLHRRKWIAVFWCTFDMLSFIGSVIIVCVHPTFENNATLFLVMVVCLLKWATFFCVVCTYVWGLSEKIQDNKLNTMPVSPIRMGTRRGLWLIHGKRELGKMKISTKL